MPEWEVKRLNPAVFDCNFTMSRTKDWEQYVLLTSDRHHDNPKSMNGLEYRHMDLARERGAPVIDLGDFFCAMQGKYDRRADKSSLKPEHQVVNYLDALISTTADDFEKWADIMPIIGAGNHETAILKQHETNLTERLCQTLSDRTGHKVHAGGYTGWVRFRFKDPTSNSVGPNFSKRLFWQHGYGGGGPVTKGVIQANRRATYLPDADLVASGHVHERWAIDYERIRLTSRGTVKRDTQIHICNPTYKEEYGLGAGGFHVERGAPPKPIGATWLRFHYDRHADAVNVDVNPAR